MNPTQPRQEYPAPEVERPEIVVFIIFWIFWGFAIGMGTGWLIWG